MHLYVCVVRKKWATEGTGARLGTRIRSTWTLGTAHTLGSKQVGNIGKHLGKIRAM